MVSSMGWTFDRKNIVGLIAYLSQGVMVLGLEATLRLFLFETWYTKYIPMNTKLHDWVINIF